jgi:hypothetical protein
LLPKDNKRLTKNKNFYLKGRNIIMKNIGWLGIVIIALGLGFSLGWSQSAKIDAIGERKINKIKKSRLIIKKSELIPRKIEILEFYSEILNEISNEEDIKYIENHYAKGEYDYILKENITVKDKSKIYDIFASADLDVIEAIDGCE